MRTLNYRSSNIRIGVQNISADFFLVGFSESMVTKIKSEMISILKMLLKNEN